MEELFTMQIINTVQSILDSRLQTSYFNLNNGLETAMFNFVEPSVKSRMERFPNLSCSH